MCLNIYTEQKKKKKKSNNATLVDITFRNKHRRYLYTFLPHEMRIFDFFSVRSIFISPNEQKNSIFTSGEVAKPRVKIPLLVFLSEIRNALSLKKSNFLFLFCLKIAIIKFIPMRQPSGRRHNFFPSRFASNLMLSTYFTLWKR